jgi:hypothetical protein
MSHRTAVVSLKRRALVAAAAAGAALAASVSFQAATADAYWTTLDSAAYTYGDCTLNVGMDRWDSGAYAYAWGRASCASRKASTHVTVTLKKNLGTEQTANTTVFTNSFGMGDRWLLTNWMAGCQFQAVMTVNIAGYAPTYVTSGAPRSLCGRSDRAAARARTRAAHRKPSHPVAPRIARLVR